MALHAAAAAFGRHGHQWRSRWSRGGVVADAGECKSKRRSKFPSGMTNKGGYLFGGAGVDWLGVGAVAWGGVLVAWGGVRWGGSGCGAGVGCRSEWGEGRATAGGMAVALGVSGLGGAGCAAQDLGVTRMRLGASSCQRLRRTLPQALSVLATWSSTSSRMERWAAKSRSR